MKKYRSVLFLLFVVTFSAIMLSNTPYAEVSAAGIDDFVEITWTTITNFPFTVGEAQSAIVGNKLYTFGGFNNFTTWTPTRKMHLFDPIAKTWTYLGDIPRGLTNSGVTTDGTNIYYAGGYPEKSGGGQTFATDESWRYNVTSNSFTALPSLPQKRGAGQLVLLGGELHFIAGSDINRKDVADHYALSLDSLAPDGTLLPGKLGWQTLPALPNPRRLGAAVVADGKIYYIGGQHNYDNTLVPQTDVHCYNPAAQTWEKMASLTEGRNHIGSTTFMYGRRIFVLAGQSFHNKRHNTVYAYDLNHNTWATLSEAALPQTRDSGIGGVINGRFYYSQGWSVTTFSGIPVIDLATLTPVSSNTPTHTATATLTETFTSTATPSETSTYTPTPIDPPLPVITQEWVQNGGFETQTVLNPHMPENWQPLHFNLQSDRVRCDGAGQASQCAMQFKGAIGKPRVVLLQKIDGSDFLVRDRLTLSAQFKGQNMANPRGMTRIVARVKQPDRPVIVLRLEAPRGTYGYTKVKDSLVLSANVIWIKVSIIFNCKQGKLLVDNVSLLSTRVNYPLITTPDGGGMRNQ